ncbi:MAG: hypothetical protein JEZ10_08295 [Verrucomicrobia bacterium]|nr:hypothetical protein [Verrucomicrobiota bacterium]
MPRILKLIGAVLLIASPGFSEVLITAQDYAVDSDVVLESAVKEILSVPRDTIDVIGDSVKYVKDEAVIAAQGVSAVFKADPHATAQIEGELAVENSWDLSNDILFRSYKVSDEIGGVLMTCAGLESGPSVDVRSFFEGIEFSKKTSAFYLPKLNRLFVRHTQENILAIESVLAEYQSARRELLGHQIEIETKFVEVSQSTLNELGFSWQFESNSGGDLEVLDKLFFPAGQDILASGLRTAASAIGAGTSPGVLSVANTVGDLRWNLFISALEQADDTDVLSAPRVVTRAGNTATIQVGEEQYFPKSFDVNNQDLSPWVEHSDWDLELMGVQLEVTPELREGGLIDLEIIPKVIDLIGFDTYQVVPDYAITSWRGEFDNRPDPIAGSKYVENIPGLSGSLPYFRIREMETRVTVADGSTVGMGGLIYDKLETFRDKVPVLGSIPLLGRLFRSEGEKSTKRNLMIFVTATQVDLNGHKLSDIALNK